MLCAFILVFFCFVVVFGMEKQAQLNRHEVILKKCFLHVYSGPFVVVFFSMQ